MSTDIGFLQEGDTGFTSVSSWWNLQSAVLNMGLASQILARCDIQGWAPSSPVVTEVPFLSSH